MTAPGLFVWIYVGGMLLSTGVYVARNKATWRASPDSPERDMRWIVGLIIGLVWPLFWTLMIAATIYGQERFVKRMQSRAAKRGATLEMSWRASPDGEPIPGYRSDYAAGMLNEEIRAGRKVGPWGVLLVEDKGRPDRPALGWTIVATQRGFPGVLAEHHDTEAEARAAYLWLTPMGLDEVAKEPPPEIDADFEPDEPGSEEKDEGADPLEGATQRPR